MGATGLQIDSMRFGDADRDRDVDAQDLALWAAGGAGAGERAACGHGRDCDDFAAVGAVNGALSSDHA